MRLIPAVLALVFALPSLQAQSGASVEEELRYVRGLVERRMHCLALEVLGEILESTSTSEGEKASALLEVAAVHKDRFIRGFTREERLEAAERAGATYRKFMERFRDHPEIIRAMADYGEFLLYLGQYHLRLWDEILEVGGDAGRAGKHRAAARTTLNKAADLFDELLVLVVPPPCRARFQSLFANVRFHRATIHYDLARAEKDETARLVAYREGVGYLEDYIFENEDNLWGYWGYLFLGLCLRELPDEMDWKESIACFEGIIAAANRMEVLKALQDDAVLELFENAYWRLAETLNRFGRFREAVEKVEQFEATCTKAGVEYGNAGHRAVLEKAKARFQTGEVAAALDIVSGVSVKAGASNGFIQHLCNRRLAGYLDTVEDPSGMDVAVVLRAARGAYGQKRYRIALRYFQTALSLTGISGREALECWDFTGRCYRQLGLLRESALAHATGAFRFRTADEARALDLARGARNSLVKILKRTRSPEDRARLEAHKKRMDREFHRDPARKHGYERVRARRIFSMVLAADKESSKAVRMLRYREVLKEADNYLKYVKMTSLAGEPGKSAVRNQALGVVHLARATALRGLEKWDEGLAVLEYFRSGVGAGRDVALKAAVLGIRFRLGKGNLEAAVEELRNLKARYAEARKTVVNLSGILGAEFKAMSERLADAGDPEDSTRALLTSVSYRLAWVKGTDARVESLVALGKDLVSLNHFDRARPFFEAVLEKWGHAEKPRRGLAVSLKLARLYLARCKVRKGEYAEAQAIYRGLYEKNKRDRKLFFEYAALLTGTVEFYDGKYNYLPGRGACRKDAVEGYKLWSRMARGGSSVNLYLRCRFHQNLVRWAQGKTDFARKGIELLRVHLGQRLDQGEWEKRFAWLEKALRRKAPRTPPPPPAPFGKIEEG